MTAAVAARPWQIALTGLVALAVAMGLGRFAFTPILPMMLADGVVDLPQASWLASANYLGYLLGAVACTLQPWLWSRLPRPPAIRYAVLVRGGLLATGVLTLAMALPAPALWPTLRFAAGLASAVVFVFSSSWCMSQITRLGQPAMGGVIFAGPGSGIVVSGLLVSSLVAHHWSAANAWAVMGVLAFVLTAGVWPVLRGPGSDAERLVTLTTLPAGAHGSGASWHEMAWLTLGYGMSGFGYIITATFLPVIARAALPGSVWLDLFWPVFGAGVMIGALLATRVPLHGDRRRLLAGCYLVQALAVGISLLEPSVAGFVLSSLLLGLPFTALTFFSLQEVRRLKPDTAASFMGLLTAMYGLGQVLGPALVAVLLRHTGSPAEGFRLGLETAVAALLTGVAIFGWMMRRYPVRPA